MQPAPNEEHLLNIAEQKLAAGDREGAQKLANEVLQHNHGGEAPGHAVFILAQNRHADWKNGRGPREL